MFDKIKFAKLLNDINDTYDTMTEFAKKSAVNRTYLSQYINMKLDSPPTPKILEKITSASNGITTYNELMQVCGYIYITELTPTSYGIGDKYWKMIFGNVEKVELSPKGSIYFSSFLNKLTERMNKCKSDDDCIEIILGKDLAIPKKHNPEEFAEYNRIASFVICSLINTNTLPVTNSEKDELLDIVQEQLNIASSITQNVSSSNDLLRKIGAVPLSDIETTHIPILRNDKGRLRLFSTRKHYRLYFF